MSQYIASRIVLDQKRECSNRACGCYSEKGYFIKYTNRNVDGVLFVCEECFEKKYKNLCNIEDVICEEEHPQNKNQREIDAPKLRKIIRIFNRSIRCLRYIVLILMIISTIIIIGRGNYGINSIKTPEINNVEISNVIEEKLEKLTERVRYVFGEKRVWYDSKCNE